jgi:uncharacterized damage-inducible protein DinB
MAIQTLQILYKRDLEKTKAELLLYKHEAKIWIVDKDIPNSTGNLVLHIVGNLKAYVGFQLGNVPYTRERDLEFSSKDISREVLSQMLDETIAAVHTGLGSLTEAQLAEDFPLVVFKEKTTIEYMLMHLAMHLSYHLGQINYHRRLLDV